MAGLNRWNLSLLLLLGIAAVGCKLRQAGSEVQWDPDLAHFKDRATQIDYPNVESSSYPVNASTPAPITIQGEPPAGYWELSLDEALQLALANSQVTKDLGSLIRDTRNVQVIRTTFDPALTETDPRLGVEAALSAFDASFAASAFFEKNDRALNNVFFGGGTRLFQQDLHRYQAELSKTSATGGRFSLRKIIDYDANNSPGNNDPALPWGTQVEGEFRQPLLQGAGAEFNRIAGPDAQPGTEFRGVVIARIRTDISLTEFEIGIRNLVHDVESLYWELYYAYQDLEAKKAARDRALFTWRAIENLRASGRRGGEAELEAQAREQYFRLEEEVQNGLTGRLTEKVRTVAFHGAGGVHSTERRLRLLMGIPVSDGRLIRPSDEPLKAQVVFPWDEILVEALVRRPELRQQKWLVKQAELERLASRNYLLPRVDAVGRYRFRGLGHNLTNAERQPNRFDNAVQDLTTGDFQEWQMGVEVELPIGMRKEFAAVRNAELLVARRKAILDAQEQEVVHDLSAAYAEIQRAYAVTQTNLNRRLAALQQLQSLENKYLDADESEKMRLLDLLLNAQRRVAEADTGYVRALIEYTLAVKNIHMQKGSLLDYNDIHLAEGRWPEQAYRDAAQRERLERPIPPVLERRTRQPEPVSQGPYGQQAAPVESYPALPEEIAPGSQTLTPTLPSPE